GKSSSVRSARWKRKVTTQRVAMIGSHTSTPATRQRRSGEPFFFAAAWPGTGGSAPWPDLSKVGVLNGSPPGAALRGLPSRRRLCLGPRGRRTRARLGRGRPLAQCGRRGAMLRGRGGCRHARRYARGLGLGRLRGALGGRHFRLRLRVLRGRLRLLALGEVAFTFVVRFEVGLVPAAALEAKHRRGHELLHRPLAARGTLPERRIADLLHHLGVELAALALVFVEGHGYQLVVCGELPAAAIIAACSQASGGLVEDDLSRARRGADVVPGGEPALEDALRQRVLDLLLDGALQ